MTEPGTDQPSASMLIAASIIRAHPEIADDPKLLRSILNGLKKAILDEREACRKEAEKHYDWGTANRPEYSDVETAVRFTKKVVAANISNDIGNRGNP
jgi:hypothetical protein